MTDEHKKLEQIQKLVREKKIIFAPQSRLLPLQPWLNKIREALHIKSWWISDESTIGDFHLDDYEFRELRATLGVEISRKDYLVDVAERLKNAESVD